MVPRMMDQTAGNLIKRWCIEQGVDVRTSTGVEAITSDPEGDARFILQCGTAGNIPADLVVVATGVRPGIDFLAGSGIETSQGVVVDDRQRTSVPEIYAAGDVCEGIDWSSGERAVHAIQPVAAETARVAALNMAGGDVMHRGSLGMNVLDTLGLISASYGQWMGVPGGDSAEQLDETGYRYIKLQFDDDRLVGAITLGRTQHIGVLRGLIQSRIRLGEWKRRLMQDPNRIMEAYLACTQPL
jgi:NAD(P)H-nitrite reductase large subunit